MKKKYLRTNKFIEPKLQMRFTLTFIGTAALALLVQGIMVRKAFTDLANALPQDGATILAHMPSITAKYTLLSFALLFPLAATVGVLQSFRIAGPVYRMKTHLRALIRGEQPGECQLRKGDDLQDLCQLMNEATLGSQAQPEHDRQDRAA